MDIRGNFPNPFNTSTTISFKLPTSGFTNLIIYNIIGQKIRELYSRTLNAGTYNIVWGGRNDNSSPVSSGLYVSRLVSGDRVANKKMMLMK